MDHLMALIIESPSERMRSAMRPFHLIAELRQLFEGWCRIREGLLAELEGSGLQASSFRPVANENDHALSHLALVESQSLDLPLLLQTVNDVLVAPTNLVGQTLQNDAVR